MIQALGGVEGILEHTLFKGNDHTHQLIINVATPIPLIRYLFPHVGGVVLGEGQRV